MPSIIEHLNKISALQPLLQGVSIPAVNFERYGNRFDDVFNGINRPFVTRKDVFESFKRSNEIGCLTAIAWGFPKGVKPGGGRLDNAINGIPHFLAMLNIIRNEGINEINYREINSLYGVKNGVTTKILYFSQSRTENSNANALILDSRALKHMMHYRWDEYKNLTKTLRPSRMEPTSSEYLEFLGVTKSISDQTNWSPDAIEMYMFSNVPSMKSPAHN